jgi:hypothetical protein
MKKFGRWYPLFKGGSAPPPPDYIGQAREQGQQNLLAQQIATQANRVNQITPWGSSTWSSSPAPGYPSSSVPTTVPFSAGQQSQPIQQAAKSANSVNPYDPVKQQLLAFSGEGRATPAQQAAKAAQAGVPFGPGSGQILSAIAPQQWTNTVALNPAEQEKLDRQRAIDAGLGTQAQSMLGRVTDSYAQPFTLDGAPAAGVAGFGANEEYRQAIMSRLAPDLLRQRERQEAQLIAQGVGGNTNSGAWDRAQQELGRNETDASLQALLAGYDVSNKEFDKSNTARGIWIGEQEALRDKPLNEMLALLRGSTPATNPIFNNFAQQGTGAAADISGAAGAQYGAALDKYNADQAQRAQTTSTVASAALTAAIIF